MPKHKKKTALANILYAARKSKWYTLREVEDISKGGISNAYLSQLENSLERSPSVKKLRILSRILDVNYTKLMKAAGYL